MPPQMTACPVPISSLEVPLLQNESLSATDEPATPISMPNKDILIPKFWGKERFVRCNHNVFLNLVLAVLYGISGSLWYGTAYAAYVQKLGGGRNGPFGDIEAVYGLATLATALPVGYLADRWGRSKVIVTGGFLLLATTFMQIGIMEYVGTSPDSKQSNIALWLLGGINVFWGLGEGVVDGPCAALFADSTPRGERSKYYNYLFICSSLAEATGPLVSIILFQTLGDDWSMYDLRSVMFVGLGIEVFNSMLMMRFDDKKALEDSVDTLSTSDSSDSDDEAPDNESLISHHNPNENAAMEHEASILRERQEWIPYIIFACDMIGSIGSGMTVKFFPLFFKDDVGMSPSLVQTIFFVAPLAMALTSSLGSRLASSGWGRVQTQLLFSSMGVACLYIMVFFKDYLSHRPLWLVVVYVLRTGLMNGTYPLQESILMDFVPKSQRGRWKSLDSVASFGWCGSAAVGGWVADRYDYTTTFLLTAVISSVGVAVWALLLPLVPRVEGTDNNSSFSSGQGAYAALVESCDVVPFTTTGSDQDACPADDLHCPVDISIVAAGNTGFTATVSNPGIGADNRGSSKGKRASE